MKHRIARTFTLALSLGLIAPGAHAESLRLVTVSAPNVNCTFALSCTLTVTDTSAALPTSLGYTGKEFLQSRTATAAATNVPGAGLTVYEYRLDLREAPSGKDQLCVSALTLDFGPIARLPYLGGNNPDADIYVITKAGLGSVGPSAASRDGTAVTFQFSTPLCPGQTSFFFGLASPRPPMPTKAQIHVSTQGSHPVDARRAGP